MPQSSNPVTDHKLSGDEWKEACRWLTAHCQAQGIADEDKVLQSGLDAVEILQSLEMDEEGLLIGLLQGLLPIDHKQRELIGEKFGASSLVLLRGVERMRQLSTVSQSGEEFSHSKVNEENLRKMLIAMVDDVRVVLIELARHLVLLSRYKQAEQKQQLAVGQLTLDVYAPLANRLGVRAIKWQLEDYALRYLHPKNYWSLVETLDEKRTERENYISEFIQAIQTALQAAGINGEVHGRPKHIYSIWKKMKQKGLEFEGLQDIRAVRILVKSIEDCYSVLAIVSERWRRLPGEFDDYIATPKENGYRSIHMVIIGPQRKTVEMQIRTHDMHQQSELGVAAHWRYKEAVHADESIDHKILRLRQLLEWKEELQDTDALSESGSPATEQQQIYVFTPKGTVIDLPAGSTPIDFAYTIHSEVGHRIRGAKVNDKMVPLNHHLKTGDQVHIQTIKNGHPSRDWLRNDLGYTRTRRARQRISQWFKQADHSRHMTEGRGMLERELTRRGIENVKYEEIASKTYFHRIDDMLAAIGAHDFKVSKALAPFNHLGTHPTRVVPSTPPTSTTSPVSSKAKSPSQHARRQPNNFQVDGVQDLLTRMANCCNPIPGDSIIGFITSGRGISIHQQNCNNIRNLDEHRHDRLIEVKWGDSEADSYPVEIQIDAYHHNGLLNEITQFFMNEKIEILKINMDTDDENSSKVHLRLEISDLQKLELLLKRLSSISNIVNVRRVVS